MTRALILDFGGVITRTLFETHALTERALGLTPGSLTWRGPFDPDSDPLWQSMQDDEITERQYWQQRTSDVAALAGTEHHHGERRAHGVTSDAGRRATRRRPHDRRRQAGDRESG